MIDLFDINNVAFRLGEFPISYVELIGTLAGMISVYFAARAHIFTWPTGIVNEVFFFALFFQLQLYADMILQVYFFVVTIYGWYTWGRKKETVSITSIGRKNRLIFLCAIAAATVLFGIFFSHIHELLPAYFAEPAAYPFTDSYIMVASIVATWLLARKNLENWMLWISVDTIATFLYLLKGAVLLSVEYFIFLLIASYGLYNWNKQMK